MTEQWAKVYVPKRANAGTIPFLITAEDVSDMVEISRTPGEFLEEKAATLGCARLRLGRYYQIRCQDGTRQTGRFNKNSEAAFYFTTSDRIIALSQVVDAKRINYRM